jgi:Condensation domain
MRLCAEFLAEEVDLTVGPLLAARLFVISGHESVLIIAREALITDRASSAIFHRELWSVYEQAARAVPIELPQLPLQLADHATWQHHNHAQWRMNHEAYWRERLTGARSMVVPRDMPIAEENKAIYTSARFSFDATLTGKLRALAWSKQTLLAVVVLGIYAVVISRWSKRADILVTFISHGRQRAALEGMVGLLANLVRLRLETRDDAPLDELLSRIHLEVRAAYAHED